MIRLPVIRPRVRGDCVDGPRPCPWVSCKHHLLLTVAEDGRVFINRKLEQRLQWGANWDERDDIPESCALDVADSRQSRTANQVGDLLDLHERVIKRIVQQVAERFVGESCDLPEHPDDPYLKYSNMGADELAEIAAELRARGKATK